MVWIPRRPNSAVYRTGCMSEVDYGIIRGDIVMRVAATVVADCRRKLLLAVGITIQPTK